MASTPVQHLCVCVTVYSGVWVRGHIVLVFMSSILPAGKGTISTLAAVKMPLITSGSIPVSAIHQVHLSQSVSFKSLPGCFIYHLFTARRKRYSYRWKQMLLLWRPFYRYLSFQLSDHSIFSVLLPQTNNPTVKAVGLPSQAFCLRLALLRMRLRLLWHTSFISPTANIPKQKRSQATCMAGCHFSFRGNSQIQKLFQK